MLPRLTLSSGRDNQAIHDEAIVNPVLAVRIAGIVSFAHVWSQTDGACIHRGGPTGSGILQYSE